MQLGYEPGDWVGKLLIAIIDTRSDVRNCHDRCMTMGTAITMTGTAEGCGLTLPGAFAIPAVDADHVMSSEVGI